jgi:Glycosyl hydrolases family 16
MINLFLKIRLWWLAFITGYFNKDFSLQPTTRTVVVNEDFNGNKFHYNWQLPSWDLQTWTTWVGQKIIYVLPNVIQNNILSMFTFANFIPNEPSIKSQEITSQAFNNQKYGMYECNMKVGGQWDAFWLWFSDNQPKGQMTYEVDIMEMEGDSDDYYTCTVHSWGVDGETDKILGTTRVKINRPLSENFHIFACDWQPTYMDFFLDGIKIWHYTGEIPNCNCYCWISNGYKTGFSTNYTKQIRISL